MTSIRQFRNYDRLCPYIYLVLYMEDLWEEVEAAVYALVMRLIMNLDSDSINQNSYYQYAF